MTCRELVEFLNAYLNGDLSPAESADFERHFKVCEPCVKYLDQYKKTIALGKSAFAPNDRPVSDAVPPSLVNAILAARKKKGA